MITLKERVAKKLWNIAADGIPIPFKDLEKEIK